LQAATRVPLVSGFSANLFHSVRQVFTPASNEARATSGTLDETQASYLAMKSSHSGTPIFSPVDAVDELVELDVEVEVAGVLAVVLVLLLELSAAVFVLV
jgi:hypothetical protein